MLQCAAVTGLVLGNRDSAHTWPASRALMRGPESPATQHSVTPLKASPSSWDSLSVRRLSENLLFISSSVILPGLGLPKWDATTTLAPCPLSRRSVGRAASTLVQSVTDVPSLTVGTLKSTRTRTSLPVNEAFETSKSPLRSSRATALTPIMGTASVMVLHVLGRALYCACGAVLAAVCNSTTVVNDGSIAV